MLETVRTTNPSKTAVVGDGFSGVDAPLSSSSEWDVASWVVGGSLIVVESTGYAGASASLNNSFGNVLATAPNINTNESYTISLEMPTLTMAGTSAGNGFLRIYCRMDDSSPVNTNSIYAELLKDSDVAIVTASIKLGSDDSVLATDTWSSLGPRIMRFTINSDDPDNPGVGTTAELAWGYSTDFSQNITANISGHTAPGNGIGIELKGSELGAQWCDNFSVSYTVDAATLPRDALVASSNGGLNYEQDDGTMAAVTFGTMPALRSDTALQGADRLGKLYIAEGGDVRIEGTAGTITNGVLDDSTPVDNWSSYSIDPDGDVVEITTVASGTGEFASASMDGVYEIDSIHNTNGLTLKLIGGATLTSADDATTCSYRVLRGPKYFDASDQTINRWRAEQSVVDTPDRYGIVPIGCSIVTVYKDRMVMAGDPNNDGVWYMSAQGNANDWDYGGGVDGSAGGTFQSATASTAANSDSGGLPAPITALATRGDDYLLISAETELYILRGDPLLGGQLDRVSSTVGIIDKHAWCLTPGGELFFMGKNGLNVLGPSGISTPVPVSEDKIPDDLQNIDTSIYSVSMKYDVAERGIHIFLTPSTALVTIHYWFDTADGAFWPQRYFPEHEPAVIEYAPKTNRIVLGCRDGYLRYFSPTTWDDSGSNFRNYVLLGPIRMGSNDLNDGVLLELQTVLAEAVTPDDETTGEADVSIHVGDTPEAASAAVAFDTWTRDPGLNYAIRPDVSGHDLFIKIAGTTSTRTWAMERVTAVLEDMGVQVKL